MAKQPRKRIRLAQNFLRSPGLVRSLVERSSIGPGDTVYEIGPGRGIITAELARKAGNVIAVEKDPALVKRLRDRFRAHENVEIAHGDFLRWQIAEREYKIFASIPYNATAEIVRKILYDPPVPSEAHLIMQREAAMKFAGLPRETLFSVLAKPFFDFEIVRNLRRTDFEPVPQVDSVLLRIVRRRPRLIEREDLGPYRDFVGCGFQSWKRNLRTAYKRRFTYKQWKRLAHDLRFPLNATPTDLAFDQWLGLFKAHRNVSIRPPERDPPLHADARA